MIYIVAILIFICLAFVSGYLLFRYMRKKSDIEIDRNNASIKYVEDLRKNVIQQFDVVISTLSPNFRTQMNIVKSIKQNIEKTPFIEIQKNYNKLERLQKMDQQLKELDEYITNIGIEYVSEETVLSLVKKLNF
jgi:predicted methyltransferase